jgi:hypothetical protein
MIPNGNAGGSTARLVNGEGMICDLTERGRARGRMLAIIPKGLLGDMRHASELVFRRCKVTEPVICP